MKNISDENYQRLVDCALAFVASKRGKKKIVEALRKSEQLIKRLEKARRVDHLSLLKPMTI